MTVAISIAGTIVSLLFLGAVYRAGIKKGSIDTLTEIRRAVHLAGLEGTVTYSAPSAGATVH